MNREDKMDVFESEDIDEFDEKVEETVEKYGEENVQVDTNCLPDGVFKGYISVEGDDE